MLRGGVVVKGVNGVATEIHVACKNVVVNHGGSQFQVAVRDAATWVCMRHQAAAHQGVELGAPQHRHHASVVVDEGDTSHADARSICSTDDAGFAGDNLGYACRAGSQCGG
jgi:hypothetical protein